MRSLSRILCTAVAVAMLLVPLSLLGDEIPTPLTKKITVGVSTVHYAGQTIRFNTPVPLKLRLEPLTPPYRIQIVVSIHPAWGGGGQQGSQANDVEIYWENTGEDIYNGPPPPVTEPWDDVLNTESGFTEK